MNRKDYSPLLIVLAIGPPLIVPIIAYVLVKEHPYWAIGVGLGVGMILAIAAVLLLVSYKEMLYEEEKKETQQAKVREAVKAGDAVDIAILNMQKLDEYYTLNKNQARNSFIVSIGAVCVGFAAILIAARFASSDPKQAIAGALGGVLLNFIGGGFFVMYNKSLDQLNLFYGKLVRLQDTMLAVQQCDKLPQADVSRVREAIILELVRRRFDGEVGTPKAQSAGKAKTKAERAALAAAREQGQNSGPRRQAGGTFGRPESMARAASVGQAGAAE